ncbi:MAG TPA: GDP-mannose 4,6-dehydratase [Patescibacteria group bacterium]
MTETILITGGTGFAGSHLVEYLLGQGETEVHVTSARAKSSFVHSLLPTTRIHQVDLTNQAATFDLIKNLQPTHIYHLAALSTVGGSFNTPEEIINNNTSLQVNILEAVRLHASSARVLVIGSAQEYDVIGHPAETIDENHPLGPSNPYGVSKVNQDLLGLSYVYAYNLDIIRARPFNHIGERQAPDFAVSAFAHQINEARQGTLTQIKVGNLAAVRDFTDVKDIARAYATLMEKGVTGEVYNIGSGQGRTMEEILQMMVKLAGVKVEVVVDQARFRPIDVPKMVADVSKIQTLGWTPQIPLEKTLARILDS